jgi:hypothetical protein
VKSSRVSEAEHVAVAEEKGSTYRGLVGNPEGKSQFGTRRHRWADSIKMHLK